MAGSIQQRVQHLRKKIRRHDQAYYVLGHPTISDRKYDELLSELSRLEKENPDLLTPDSPTQRVGGSPIEGFTHVTHAPSMLSVDNTYDEKQLREFDKRVAKGLGGEPYGCMIGDYHFDHSPPDVELLGEMSQVAAAAHAPFIAAAGTPPRPRGLDGGGGARVRHRDGGASGVA